MLPISSAGRGEGRRDRDLDASALEFAGGPLSRVRPRGRPDLRITLSLPSRHPRRLIHWRKEGDQHWDLDVSTRVALQRKAHLALRTSQRMPRCIRLWAIVRTTFWIAAC